MKFGSGRVEITISLPPKQIKYVNSCGIDPGRIIESALFVWIQDLKEIDKDPEIKDNTKN